MNWLWLQGIITFICSYYLHIGPKRHLLTMLQEWPKKTFLVREKVDYRDSPRKTRYLEHIHTYTERTLLGYGSVNTLPFVEYMTDWPTNQPPTNQQTNESIHRKVTFPLDIFSVKHSWICLCLSFNMTFLSFCNIVFILKCWIIWPVAAVSKTV